MKSGQRTSILLHYKVFVGNLRHRYPTITRQEMIIAILLRAGLSSDEIAIRLHLSVRTVENHRYNIRKKVGLNTNEVLADFLQMLEGESPMLYFSVELHDVHQQRSEVQQKRTGNEESE